MHRFRLLAALCLLALAGCASIPYERPHERDQPPPAARPADGSPERMTLNASVHDAVVGHVDRLFYRRDFDRAAFAARAAAMRPATLAAPDEAGLYAHIRSLLEALDDDHSHAFSPTARERRAAQRSGQSRAGWGLATTEVGGRHRVQRVQADGPAAAAGVLPGWWLVSVDGQPPTESAPPLEGRSAHLVFEDEHGARHGLDLVARALPPRPRREARTLPDGIAYLRFDDFDQASEDWLGARLVDLAGTRPPAGVVLDLRDNGGGHWDVAARILARFHAQPQTLLVLHGRLSDHRIGAPPPARVYEGPLAVLVGPGTASAAELLAARLQETGRARLFGERSRGAVVGTRGINLPDGGLLRVGMWAITTGGGRALEKVGVSPDVPLAPDWAAIRAGRDPALEAAAQALLGER